jgi:hypothetical protein
MITREEAIRRLEDVAVQINEIKKALEQGWNETGTKDPTQTFLEKCRGWEDTRSPEEIVADIHAERTISNRGATIFRKEPQ